MNLSKLILVSAFLFFSFLSPVFSRAVQEQDLKSVFPAASNFEPVEKGRAVIYYNAVDCNGNLLGVVFTAVARSYGGNIETLAGMLMDGTITEIKVLSENETPGLGSRVKEAGFTEQFRNKKDLSGVHAITGATISSQALIDSVKKKADEVKAYIK